jgi:eukaryotic-like serine/threonine-protein kinase
VTTQTSAWQGDQSHPTNPGRAVPGTVVGGRYRLRVAIGTGGMGTVWQASDTVLHRDVAVKEVVLPPGMAGADRNAMFERTLREARAAAALSHPSVVQVYDVVTEGGRPWIIMELLQARSLAEMIIQDGPLAPRAVAKIGVALLGALEVAHSAGVLHRDVKPANVLICTDGRCVLTDFGVARMPSESNLTTPGMVLGSPHFISPERAVGGKFGPPSDLFSLGVTLYTAVEGRPPFDRGDPFDTMRAVVEEEPARMVRAGTLAGVLTGLLEKDPDRRWDVNQARAALRDLLDGTLANRAVHHVTDPYAVVPPAPVPPMAQPELPTGRVGGRAMILPGNGTGYDEPEFRGPAFEAPQGPPTNAWQPAPPQAPPTNAWQPAPPPQPAAGRQVPPPPQWSPSGSPVLAGTDPELAHLAQRRPPGQPAGTAPGRARSAFGWLKALPRAAQIGIAAGVVVVVALGAVLLVTRGGSPAANAGPAPSASASADTPLIPNPQKYTDKASRFTLNVPASWKQAVTSNYVDFTDPEDSGRRLRVNVERSGDSAEDFLVSAENQLKKKTTSCAAPYTRVGLKTDVTLDGRPAAELEYECGSGDSMRHGIWRATIQDKQAFEFFLTVPDSQFAASKAIYDEAVRTYHLTTS